MDSIYQRIKEQFNDKANNYRVYVNRANLTIDVLYDKTNSTSPRDQWDMPASYMLLIQEDQMHSFFENNELPSDTTAILSSLTTEVDTLGNISYYFSYDLSGFLTHQMRSQLEVDEFNFLLVPVAVVTAASSTSSSSVTSIRPLQTITATHIRSANNSEQPMDLEMVYSGFHKIKY
jgi:hypothetical protein